MATSTISNGRDGSLELEDSGGKVPVVLRVKRKRTDDPAESLVVKKLKLDSLLAQNEDGGSSVFHLVGTFPKHDVSETEVLDSIKSHKSTDHSLLVKKNPFSMLTISEKQDDRRERKKTSSQNHRFKVVSQHRQLKESEVSDDGPTPAASNGDSGSAKDLMTEMVHLYDVVQEAGEPSIESKLDSTPSKGQSSSENDCGKEMTDHESVRMEGAAMSSTEKPTKSEGAIMCNSTEMVREKHPNSNGTENEYVYDIYYTRDYDGSGPAEFYDWGSLCVHDFRYDVQLFNYDLFRPTSFSTYDDDDDSNDEDNWRNDYPDEEDLFQSDSDEEGLHSRAAYRYRDSYDDYLFDDDPYPENTSYWTDAKDDEDHW